jgi:4-amino-4-deoxychorismate lyase
MFVIVNGEITSRSLPEAVVSIFGEPEKAGSSVFETFRTYQQDKVFALEAHLERLFQSAKILQLDETRFPLRKQIRVATQTLISKNKLPNQDLRLKICLSPDHWWIKAIPLIPLTKDSYTKGVKIIDTVFERPTPEAKYSNPVYETFQQKQQKDVFETIFFSHDDQLLEGNITNVFAVFKKDNQIEVITPANQVLRGITAQSVIQAAQEDSKILWKVEQKNLSREQLQEADEIFLTNSIKEIISVSQWNKWKNQDFSITKKIHKSFKQFVHKELDKIS